MADGQTGTGYNWVIMSASPVTVLEARRRLRLFNEKAQTIINGRFKDMVFREDHGFTLNFTPEGPKGAKRGADHEATLAVAVTLRFFVQVRDQISFGQIAKLYELLPVSDRDKRNVRLAAATIGAFWKSPPETVALIIANETITNERLFEIYMYGSLVHANPDKAAFFDEWIDTPYRVTTDIIFERIVVYLIRAADWFHHVNERALACLESMDDSLELIQASVANEPISI